MEWDELEIHLVWEQNKGVKLGEVGNIYVEKWRRNRRSEVLHIDTVGGQDICTIEELSARHMRVKTPESGQGIRDEKRSIRRKISLTQSDLLPRYYFLQYKS